MWKLTIADDEDHQTVVNLVREEYTVGRGEGNAVRLTERNVSRKHARLIRSAEGYRLEDLSSYNGLYVNGMRLTRRQDLAHGDLIQLGDYRVQVTNDAVDTQEQGYRGFPGNDSGSVRSRLPHRLVELIGPNQGAEFSLDGERFLLGRGEECEFTIDHGSVSRIHAEVRTLEPGRFEIIDKGSANGLRINGNAVVKGLLDSRDVIELGDVVLKYIPEGQDFRANASEGSRIAAIAGSPPPPVPESKARTGVLPSLFAALLGAAIVAIGVTLYFKYEARDESEHSTPKQLKTVTEHVMARRLVAAAEALDQVDNVTRSLGEYREIERSWADAVLTMRASEEEQDTHRQLLDLVARRPHLPAEVREAASKQLSSLSEGAIDLGNLDDPSESEPEDEKAVGKGP